MIAHYAANRVDPRGKTLIFSDALDIPKVIELYERFRGRCKLAFGVGTNLTNDLGYKPLQIVIKMVRCNGQPVAKLSDTPEKTMCDDPGYLSYLRQVFAVQAPAGNFNRAHQGAFTIGLSLQPPHTHIAMETNAARDRIFARIRAAQGRGPAVTEGEREAVADYLARHPQGPQPPVDGDRAAGFIAQAQRWPRPWIAWRPCPKFRRPWCGTWMG
jgi:hypothetical protein